MYHLLLSVCTEELLYRIELLALFVLVFFCPTDINWSNLVNVCLGTSNPTRSIPQFSSHKNKKMVILLLNGCSTFWIFIQILKNSFLNIKKNVKKYIICRINIFKLFVFENRALELYWEGFSTANAIFFIT